MTGDMEDYINKAETWLQEYGGKGNLTDEAIAEALDWIHGVQKLGCNLPCPRCGRGMPRRVTKMPTSNYAHVHICKKCFKEEITKGEILKVKEWAFQGLSEIIWKVRS